VPTLSTTLDVLLALSKPTRWQTVMFDPLAYIHPERLHLPAIFDSPAQRAAINRLLIARYRLDLPRLPQPLQSARPRNETEELLLKHWLHLPQIVFLLGCQRLRLALARRGGLLRLPASARAFITLPLLPPALQGEPANESETGPSAGRARSAVAPAPDHATLLRHGLRQLDLGLGGLPALLAQRLPLLFAPEIDDAVPRNDAKAAAAPTTEDACDPSHALTLRMAIQHVKRHPISAE
jgi:type III secretion system OrgA/MxiK family protein